MNTLTALSHHGRCISQPASDWTGDIPLPAQIADFYEQVGPIGEPIGRRYSGVSFSAGSNEINLQPLAQLWKDQSGYRWVGGPNEPIDGWPSPWIVVATQGANAFVFDSETETIRFVAAADDSPEGTCVIPGTWTNVVGALALFCMRYEEAGDSAEDEDFVFLDSWLTPTRAELIEQFGESADGVIQILSEY